MAERFGRYWTRGRPKKEQALARPAQQQTDQSTLFKNMLHQPKIAQFRLSPFLHWRTRKRACRASLSLAQALWAGRTARRLPSTDPEEWKFPSLFSWRLMSTASIAALTAAAFWVIGTPFAYPVVGVKLDWLNGFVNVATARVLQRVVCGHRRQATGYVAVERCTTASRTFLHASWISEAGLILFP